ncbi:MAG: phage holin family protein, partial [Luteimonas sp.]|nr:phage holin family protein [Luteimonas sp.]
MADRDAQDQPGQHDDTGKPPHLDESVRRIGAAGRATIDSALDTGRALRKLVSADLALARSAMGRALAWVAVAIVFGASAWLLVMGVLTALLHSLGLS